MEDTCVLQELRGFPGGSVVMNPPVNAGMWVGSLGHEDPLENGMATHSNVLALENPMVRGAWQAIIHEVTNELDTI